MSNTWDQEKIDRVRAQDWGPNYKAILGEALDQLEMEKSYLEVYRSTSIMLHEGDKEELREDLLIAKEKLKGVEQTLEKTKEDNKGLRRTLEEVRKSRDDAMAKLTRATLKLDLRTKYANLLGEVTKLVSEGAEIIAAGMEYPPLEKKIAEYDKFMKENKEELTSG